MIALTASWRSDLEVSPTGDIGAAPLKVEIQRRLIRRLLTSPGGYIWHSSYGGGVGRFVGAPNAREAIEGVILNQISLEPSIDGSVRPKVRIVEPSDQSRSSLSVMIEYKIAGSVTGDSAAFQLGG